VADTGQMIENPVTGERMTFRRTSADTGGAELVVELELRAGAFLPAEHIHRRQEERFTVLDGRLLLRSGGDERLVTSGESVAVPAGMAHAWSTDGSTPARVAITFTPAGSAEHFFESFFRLAREGKVNDRGLANPIRMAQLSRTYDIFLARPPIAVQRPVFAMLDALGRVLGYERFPI
jgi:quercetin dioxygenase-like cupin family protein